MNLLPEEGYKLISEVTEYCEKKDVKGVDVVMAPPMCYLGKAAEISNGKRVSIGAQNCSDHESGAYTGEVSCEMIKATGAEVVIIGHSERRQLFNESDEMLNGKLKRAFATGLIPILCVGEVLEDRKANKQEEVVSKQLKGALEGFSVNDFENLVIAYEPVWAIGTGETASPGQAQDMHHFIRKFLAKQYNASIADEISILYGGSVKPSNAKDIFCEPDVDGGLIGGASLKFDDFVQLIETGMEVLR